MNPRHRPWQGRALPAELPPQTGPGFTHHVWTNRRTPPGPSAPIRSQLQRLRSSWAVPGSNGPSKGVTDSGSRSPSRRGFHAGAGQEASAICEGGNALPDRPASLRLDGRMTTCQEPSTTLALTATAGAGLEPATLRGHAADAPPRSEQKTGPALLSHGPTPPARAGKASANRARRFLLSSPPP